MPIYFTLLSFVQNLNIKKNHKLVNEGKGLTAVISKLYPEGFEFQLQLFLLEFQRVVWYPWEFLQWEFKCPLLQKTALYSKTFWLNWRAPHGTSFLPKELSSFSIVKVFRSTDSVLVNGISLLPLLLELHPILQETDASFLFFIFLWSLLVFSLSVP